MKKTLCAVLALLMLSSSLTSCAETAEAENTDVTTDATTPDESTEPINVESEFDSATYMKYTLNDNGKSYTAYPYGLPDSIKELVFPGEYKGLPVTKIDGGLGERSIETVIISEGVQEILINFDYCTGIKNIYIPSSVVYMSGNPFNCRATMGGHGFIKSNVIENIVVAEGNSCYYVDGNCLIEKSSQKIILGCNSSAIPTDGSVKSIGLAAFANCHLIESVILPKSIIEIEASAFDNCDNLKKVYITSSVSEDNKVVNFDPEPVFGYDPSDMLYVPDSESLEMYSKLLGEGYFSIGSPFSRIISIEAAKELAYKHWNLSTDSTEGNLSIPVTITTLFDDNGYHVYLKWQLANYNFSTIDKMDFDVCFEQLSYLDVQKIACDYWNVKTDSMGQCTISSVSLSVERVRNDYRIDLIWNRAYDTSVLIDWVYVDVYTGQTSFG